VFRKWLQRSEGAKLLKELKESHKGVNITEWMGGEAKTLEGLRGMQRKENRKGWRKGWPDGRKAPFYEYLRTSGKVGYTLYLSEHFRDNLISWAMEATSEEQSGVVWSARLNTDAIRPDVVAMQNAHTTA
jgi:hypothetical protein